MVTPLGIRTRVEDEISHSNAMLGDAARVLMTAFDM